MHALTPVDLNEELSAFHGQIIEDQALFLAHCVRKIATLYGGTRRVILVGHSMGGIVSRLAMTFGIEDLVDTIITLSTPHLLPPATMDAKIEQTYRKIHVPTQAALISICGGLSDTQIASDGCALDESLLSERGGFAVFTTAIPGVWTGIDHQAIVWCHQLRWRVARVLLDMTKPHARPLLVARNWLLPFNEGEQTSGLTKEAILPVGTGTQMLFLQRSANSFAQFWPKIHLNWCAQGNCRAVSHNIQALASIKKDEPFPLPGEGIKPSDIIYAVEVESVKEGQLSVALESDVDLMSYGSSVELASTKAQG